MRAAGCRFCDAPLSVTFADLGMSPLSNRYPRLEDSERMEPFFPLHARVCEHCFLVQVGEFIAPEDIFCDYPYFSSYSDSWLRHAQNYAQAMIERFGIGPEHLVVEIASNDGYLLQYFAAKNVPVLGIEPAANVAAVAVEKGIPTVRKFFSAATARELKEAGKQADLLLGNNVLAHVPDLNDFVSGLPILLAPGGVLTMEFPHLARLIAEHQFDTIYHEHFSYFSLSTVEQVFAAQGLTIFDVDQLPTHGGSLRIYARHANHADKPTPRVAALKKAEVDAGLQSIETYRSFADKVLRTKVAFLEFVLEAKRAGKRIVGYGAAAKGNTLLNYCGVGRELIDYVVDRSPHKQSHVLPGTHIPIFAPDKIRETRPDYILILPWNLREEIVEQVSYAREWGAKFVVAIPRVEVFG